VLVAAVAADGIVGPVERRRLNELLSSMRLFRHVAPGHVQRLIENALGLVLHSAPDELLAACAVAIPPELRASLYALVVELALVDGTVADQETHFTSKLQAAFAIDDVTAIGIVEMLMLLIKSRATD
jgi:uncharacterized tellurite resistance protein B-like protein